MPHFNALLRSRHVCWCAFVCMPVHADELDTEEIGFLQSLNHKEPTKKGADKQKYGSQ